MTYFLKTVITVHICIKKMGLKEFYIATKRFGTRNERIRDQLYFKLFYNVLNIVRIDILTRGKGSKFNKESDYTIRFVQTSVRTIDVVVVFSFVCFCLFIYVCLFVFWR